MPSAPPLIVTCPSCQTAWELTPEEAAGQTFTCTGCQTTFEIPRLAADVSPPVSTRRSFALGCSLAVAVLIAVLTIFYLSCCVFERVTLYTDDYRADIDQGGYEIKLYASPDRTGGMDAATPKGGFYLIMWSKGTYTNLPFKLVSAEYSLNGSAFRPFVEVQTNQGAAFLIPATDPNQSENRFRIPVIPQGLYSIRLDYIANGEEEHIEVQRNFSIRTIIQRRPPVVIEG